MLNENDVVSAVCDHLTACGYEILQRCSTSDHGIDIIAKHRDKRGRLLIEAKGGTSSLVGSARYDKGFNRNQMFDRVAKGFYTAACLSAEHRGSGDEVAMAYPDTAVFREYLSRIKSVAVTLDMQILLVKPDRTVLQL